MSREDSYVNTRNKMIMRPSDIEPIQERLETPFDVKEEWLCKELPLVSTDAAKQAREILNLFQHMTASLPDRLELIPEPSSNLWSYFATIMLNQDGCSILKNERQEYLRHQPIALFLKTTTSDQHVLLHCVSPIW